MSFMRPLLALQNSENSLKSMKPSLSVSISAIIWWMSMEDACPSFSRALPSSAEDIFPSLFASKQLKILSISFTSFASAIIDCFSSSSSALVFILSFFAIQIVVRSGDLKRLENEGLLTHAGTKIVFVLSMGFLPFFCNVMAS